MNAMAHQVGVKPVTVVSAAPAAAQLDLFDFLDNATVASGIHPERCLSIPAPVVTPPAPMVTIMETADQVRERLIREAEDRAQLKMEEAYSLAESDAAIEKLAITLRRIRQFSDEQLLERARLVPMMM